MSEDLNDVPVTDKPVTLPPRNPYEVGFAGFIFVATLPATVGLAPLPPSLRASVPGLAGHVLLAILTLGAGTILLGNAWPRPKDPRLTSVTAILIERYGLIAAVLGCLLYAVAVLGYTGLQSATALGFVAGFAVPSAVVAWQITKVIRALKQAQ